MKLTAAVLLGYEYAEFEEKGVIQIDCLKCRRILDPNPRDFRDGAEFQAWAPTVPADQEWDYWLELRPGNTMRKVVAWILVHEKQAQENGWHRSAGEDGA